MKQIVKTSSTPTIEVKNITDGYLVGVVIRDEKYIIICKKQDNNYIYSRMNDNFFILEDDKTSKKALLESLDFSKAFSFDTKKEMIHWLLS